MYFKHIHSCCFYVTHRLSSCYASSHSTPFPHNVMKTLEIISWVLLHLSDSKESTVQLCNMDISLACSSWPYPWDPSCTCTAGNGSAVFIPPPPRKITYFQMWPCGTYLYGWVFSLSVSAVSSSFVVNTVLKGRRCLWSLGINDKSHQMVQMPWLCKLSTSCSGLEFLLFSLFPFLAMAFIAKWCHTRQDFSISKLILV